MRSQPSEHLPKRFLWQPSANFGFLVCMSYFERGVKGPAVFCVGQRSSQASRIRSGKRGSEQRKKRSSGGLRPGRVWWFSTGLTTSVAAVDDQFRRGLQDAFHRMERLLSESKPFAYRLQNMSSRVLQTPGKMKAISPLRLDTPVFTRVTGRFMRLSCEAMRSIRFLAARSRMTVFTWDRTDGMSFFRSNFKKN